MQNENEKLSTDDDMISIMMDIYDLTEHEARSALRDVTVRNRMTDF
jgi:hypothetical protein